MPGGSVDQRLETHKMGTWIGDAHGNGIKAIEFGGFRLFLKREALGFSRSGS